MSVHLHVTNDTHLTWQTKILRELYKRRHDPTIRPYVRPAVELVRILRSEAAQ